MFTKFGQVKAFFTDFEQQVKPQKNPKPSPFDKKFKSAKQSIWHKLFSMIHSTVINNWVSQLIDLKGSIFHYFL